MNPVQIFWKLAVGAFSERPLCTGCCCFFSDDKKGKEVLKKVGQCSLLEELHKLNFNHQIHLSCAFCPPSVHYTLTFCFTHTYQCF